MSTDRDSITVGGVEVEVVRKSIKNIHLAVYPPDGRVRIAVPTRVDDEAIHLAVLGKLDWIRRQQRKFAEQPRQSPREMVSGESVYHAGRRYRLQVVEQNARPSVTISGANHLLLHVRPGMSAAHREAVLNGWYRDDLKRRIPALIAQWEPIMGVQVADWGVKRMKTRWGTCNIRVRRIWLNLELAKKPPECLEYVVVHEMVHLLERLHNAHFRELMDHFLPGWSVIRDRLNSAPLGHADWQY